LGWTWLLTRSDASKGTTAAPARASSALSALLLIGGCAGYGPGDLQAGAAEADVIARMGAPTDRVARPDGSRRLEYARGPMGKHTWRIEVDAAGRVRAVDQLMTEANFESVVPGATRDDVRERLGRAGERSVGWRGVGEVWSYRYESLFCRWFQVWLVDGRVREAAFAEDPMCAEPRRLDAGVGK
jgi:hypothetical protein